MFIACSGSNSAILASQTEKRGDLTFSRNLLHAKIGDMNVAATATCPLDIVLQVLLGSEEILNVLVVNFKETGLKLVRPTLRTKTER